MNSNLPHEGNSLENSDGYTDPNEQLPSADLATRRGFLRRSGSAGVAVGLFALAPLAHSDEGSGSGSGDAGAKKKERSGTLSATTDYEATGSGSAAAEDAARAKYKAAIAAMGTWSYWPIGQPPNPQWSGAYAFSGSTTVISNAPDPASQPGNPASWTYRCKIRVTGGATCTQTGYV